MKKTGFVLAFILSVIPSQAADLAGRVRFAGRPAGVAAPTIVYAEALDGGRAQPGQFKMTQKNKTFVPHVLAVPAGSTVSFPNEDQIFHNVFSLSRPVPFDLGLYRSGASKDLKLMTPSTYQVFCNIHPQMSAIILVVPTSFITEADAAGSYHLDVPAGRYRLTAWSERGQAASVEVMVTGTNASAPDLSLDESKFVEATHKNKFGQDYPKSAYDPKK